MDSERIQQLLAKQMGQTVSDREIAELNELLLLYPDYLFFIEILQSIEGEKKHYEPAKWEEDLVRENWFMLQHELDQPDLLKVPKMRFHRSQPVVITEDSRLRIRKKGAMRWVRWAAIWVGMLLISAGSFFIWRDLPKKHVFAVQGKVNKLGVAYGAPERKLLPDSSVVWLNAGSHISYADNFTQRKTREVYLDGEAYFKVKHNVNHPFIVHAGNIIIKVLGTEFDVQAYGDENHIETTLINGKVQVQITGKPDKKIILTPNEKLTVINQKFELSGRETQKQRELCFKVKEVVPLQTTTPIPEVAWLEDKLAFQNQSFDELSKKLERRYDVHIVFKDSLLEDERLSGVFENETIQKAMKILQMTTIFRYTIHGDTVYLQH